MGEPRKGWLRSIDGDESWTASSEQRANVAAHVVDPVPVVVLPVTEYEQLVAERELLRKALGEAIILVEDWADYASDYFRQKHDLAGDIARLRAALKEAGDG